MASSSGHLPEEILPLPASAVPEDRNLVAEIDRSARWPVLFYLTAGIFWLFVGAAIGMLAYFKFRHPEHLSSDPRNWLPFFEKGTFDFIPLSWVDIAPLTTFGHLKPAFHHVLIYGWACSAAIGLLMWVLARSCKAPLPAPLALLALGHVWHVGVFFGLVRILVGGPTSLEWLDMPPYILAILLLVFLGTSIPLLGMVFATIKDKVFITTKYMLAALVWFPALVGSTLILLTSGSLRGLMSTVVNFWYVDALAGLWLAPVALGAVFYLVPKITGRALGSLAYANLGFWGLALLGGATGLRHLYAHPIPEWLVTVSICASLLLAIPAVLSVAALFAPLRDGRYLLSKNVSLRFIVIGLGAFLFQHTVGAVISMGGVAKYTQFTIASDAFLYLLIYAFPSMVFFGAIYYIIPKILGVAWFSKRLVEVHFWVTIFCTLFLTIFMFAGGAAQGAVLQEPDNYISTVMSQAKIVTMLGNLFWTAITISNLLFLYNLIRSILSVYNPVPVMLGLVTAKGEPQLTPGAEVPTSNAQA